MYLKLSEMAAKPEDLGMDAVLLRQARDFALTAGGSEGENLEFPPKGRTTKR